MSADEEDRIVGACRALHDVVLGLIPDCGGEIWQFRGREIWIPTAAGFALIQNKIESIHVGAAGNDARRALLIECAQKCRDLAKFRFETCLRELLDRGEMDDDMQFRSSEGFREFLDVCEGYPDLPPHFQGLVSEMRANPRQFLEPLDPSTN